LNNNSSVHVKARANHKVVEKTSAMVKVPDQTIYRLAEIFKLMADKSRLKVLIALANEGELHVSALCELLGQSQPAVSHHLTLMRMTGLVGYRRDGKHNFYHLQSGIIRDLLDQCFGETGAGSKQLQFEDFTLSYKRK
jgi:ArsR family transcriptional regulator, arsenate/arsenite/antimonite-responsive transcriptional repressor